MCMSTHKHTDIHARTHKCACAHTHTHTHTNTPKQLHPCTHAATPLKPQIPHLSQTGEHASHGLVVQTIGAVDDDHIHAQRLAQVLGGLCLPGSGGSLGAATTVKVKGCGEGHVAAISEGGDDQAPRVAQVLVAILELGVGLSHDAVVILLKGR